MIGHRGLWALFCNFYCPSAKLQCTASIPRHCCYLYPQSYQFSALLLTIFLLISEIQLTLLSLSLFCFCCSAPPDSAGGKKNKIPLYNSEKKDPMIHDQETSDLVWRTSDLLSLLQEVSSDDLPLLLEFSSVPDTLLCSICVSVCVSLLHWIPMSTWQWEEYLAWSKLNSLLVKSSNAM